MRRTESWTGIAIAICLISPAIALADIPYETPILAPDPGDPPVDPDELRRAIGGRYVIGGLAPSAAVVSSGFVYLGKRKRGDSLRWQDWILLIGVPMGAVTIVAVLLMTTLPSTTKEYWQWKEKHDAFKRGDVIGTKLETPKRDWIYDEITGKMIAY